MWFTYALICSHFFICSQSCKQFKNLLNCSLSVLGLIDSYCDKFVFFFPEKPKIRMNSCLQVINVLCCLHLAIIIIMKRGCILVRFSQGASAITLRSLDQFFFTKTINSVNLKLWKPELLLYGTIFHFIGFTKAYTDIG